MVLPEDMFLNCLYKDLICSITCQICVFMISACPAGYYGAGCKEECKCKVEGKCDRFRGCLCAGRHGARCEQTGRNYCMCDSMAQSCKREFVSKESILVPFPKDTRPVIISSLRDAEINAGVEYRVNCSAAGQPAPLHGEISLLKADKSTLYVSSITLLMSFNSSVIQTLMIFDFWLSWGCGHTDRNWSDNVHVPGGKDGSVWCWSLVMSRENENFSWGERIPGTRQRWEFVSRLCSPGFLISQFIYPLTVGPTLFANQYST